MKHIVEPLFVSHCILVQYCFLSFVSIILRHLCLVHQVRAEFSRWFGKTFLAFSVVLVCIPYTVITIFTGEFCSDLTSKFAHLVHVDTSVKDTLGS